jgi:hypothetical protein
MDQDSDLTEKALESVDEQVTANEDDEKKYKISPSKKDKIQSIVDKIDRYDSLDEFIDESIDNTIDFWLHPETMNDMANRMWPSFTREMKDEIKKTAPIFYNNMMQNTQVHNKIAIMVKQIRDDKRPTLSKEEFSVPENIVLGDAYSLIHQSYNRFFPLKILVTSLRLMIEKNNTRWIEYDEFSREGLDISLEFSNKLKKIKEKGKNPKRNIRISTGLPISHTAIYDEDMKELGKNLQEKSDKDKMSRQRFFDCFIGPKETTLLRLIDAAEKEEMNVFSGALNETGLVHIRNNNGKLEITLSEHGFEFSSYDNPIINGIKIIDSDNGEIKFSENVDGIIEKKIFSNEERKFIMNEIIPKFKLEKIIIENILQKIKNEHEVNTETLDEIIINTVIKWRTENEERARDEKLDEKNKDNYRIATMGRLAEIGEVEWDIKEGKSAYSIPT